jgi:hypothetical protein
MRNENRDQSPGDAGFSLAESLIATMLTLMVIASALGMFNNSVRLADTTRIVSETNQNLQVATSLMVRDFIQAGRGIPQGGVPIPSGAGASAIVRPGPTALTFPGSWVTLPAVSPGANLGPTLLGVPTDIVTILYEDATLNLAEFPLTVINGNANQIRVDPRTSITGPDGLRVGDLLLFSNALGNAVRMITSIPGGPQQQVTLGPNDPLNINQTNAAQGSLQNLEIGPNQYPPTTATRIVMVTYYIDNVTDPALPRLVRQVNAGQQLAIALGAENLQISFDLVDGVTNPSNVDTPAAANSPHQIRKVNLFLSARSIDRSPKTNNFFRNSIATQIGLRSLSFVDRYQ